MEEIFYKYRMWDLKFEFNGIAMRKPAKEK